MQKTSLSPFGKVKGKKYVIIEMLMFVKYIHALKFLWKINKEGKHFLIKQYDQIENGFANEGLIKYTFRTDEPCIFNLYSSYE